MGGDFDGDVFQFMPVTCHKPLDEVEHPNRDWSDLAPLAEELQAEVDKFKYDTAANMDYVNAVREKVGRELVWLEVHKDPDVFVRETRLSPSDDAVSHLWNHVTGQFRAWERAPQPPRHFPRACCPPSLRRGSTRKPGSG